MSTGAGREDSAVAREGGPWAGLRALTVDQWAALWRDYPVQANPDQGTTLKVLGLYLLGCIVLILNEYVAGSLWTVLPEAWTRGPSEPMWRKCGWALGVAFFYCVPTAAYARWVLGLRLRDLGLQLRGLLAHVPLYLFFFGVVFPFVVLVSDDPHFLKTYPLARIASQSWTFLGLWMFAYAMQFVGVEFFFRGFLLFAPLRVLGPWVLPGMVMAYCMLHFEKPGLESVGSIIAGTTLGIVALRTRSIYAGMVIHIAVAWSMDALAMWHRGELQRLLGW